MSCVAFSRWLECFALAMAFIVSGLNDVHAHNARLESSVRERASAIEAKLIAWRRDIHQHPELVRLRIKPLGVFLLAIRGGDQLEATSPNFKASIIVSTIMDAGGVMSTRMASWGGSNALNWLCSRLGGIKCPRRSVSLFAINSSLPCKYT
jgi:hypothetical protein